MARNWIVFIHWIIICLWFKWLFLTKELLHFFVCLVMLKNCLHRFVFTSSTQHSMTGLIKSCLRIIEPMLFFPLSACLSFTLHVVPLCHYMYNYNLLKTTINDQPFFFPVWWIFSSNVTHLIHMLLWCHTYDIQIMLDVTKMRCDINQYVTITYCLISHHYIQILLVVTYHYIQTLLDVTHHYI